MYTVAVQGTMVGLYRAYRVVCPCLILLLLPFILLCVTRNIPYTVEPNISWVNFVLRHFGSNVSTAELDGYGCWCNGAHQGTPVDAIDSCCQMQYNCYKELTVKYRCTEESTIYSYSACPGQISCDINDNVCTRGRCQCDVSLGMCFLDQLSLYEIKNYNYNPERCRTSS